MCVHNHDEMYAEYVHNHDDKYSKTDHNHDEIYSTIELVSDMVDKMNQMLHQNHDYRYTLHNHSHLIANITGLQSALTHLQDQLDDAFMKLKELEEENEDSGSRFLRWGWDLLNTGLTAASYAALQPPVAKLAAAVAVIQGQFASF